MRNRSNSGVRLDFYNRIVQKTILKYQNPVTGLLPATPTQQEAWVRDNVYSILAVWGLALAYRKAADLDEDRAKAYELEQSVVKLMRGVLQCMMAQIDKVEKFKSSQNVRDCLHAKYSVRTGKTVVSDDGWGHLQIDATSLYLLMLAQMTASGLQIVYTLDEVTFIQNLVFYIHHAYRIPDFGIWERGDKTNHGIPELNCTSIGMAKAALEALNDLDLFGSRGGPASVIHVMPGEAEQCRAILHSVLPRESNSKEVDAGLLTVISFPAFAVDDSDIVETTRETIFAKLLGKHGLCRFLRDGYKCPREDPNRLYYHSQELAGFENLECEWPMFFAYLVLDGLFTGRDSQVDEYMEKLEAVMIKREDGMKLMPELYVVPGDKVDAEIKNPQSQARVPDGKIPHMWGQSLYVLAKLIKEGFLSPGEIDPLNRRLVAETKPDIVVQVVILAEDEDIQEKLDYHGLKVQTISQVAPVQVYPARILSSLHSKFGQSKRLRLSGRPQDTIGILATSRLFTLGDQILAFFPQFVDQGHFYLPLDVALLVDMIKTDIQFVGSNWRILGRPLVVFPIRSTMLGVCSPVLPERWPDFAQALHPALVATVKKLQTGYISGTRVSLRNLSDFVNTSCISSLDFLTEMEDSPDVAQLLRHIEKMGMLRMKEYRLASKSRRAGRVGWQKLRRKTSVFGIVRRSVSIQINPEEMIDDTDDMPLSPGGIQAALAAAAQEAISPDLSPTPPTGFFDNQPGLSPSKIPSHPHLRGQNPFETSISAYHDEEYEGMDISELVEQLKDSEGLHEQADIIHYLYTRRGPDFEVDLNNQKCRMKDLLNELYEKAGQLKQWWLVRHTAGLLNKRVEDLSRAATDILVRQKQLAVGLPPAHEIIIEGPLPPNELAARIAMASGNDLITAMLTQEILVYLAMFIRTEPKLFGEMLRLRVGLIIQVMASEMAKALKCSGEKASDELLNLSPFEMKTLLHHILSGKEFGVRSGCLRGHDDVFSIKEGMQDTDITIGEMITSAGKKSRVDDLPSLKNESEVIDESDEEEASYDRHGQWLRRRRLDGALNRVPIGFYQDVWKLMTRCNGLTIGADHLEAFLTREMTPGEFKFALRAEAHLNRIPQPEYRQLMVEAITVLCLIVEQDTNRRITWNQHIAVDYMVHLANDIFVEEQAKMDGDVTLCCGVPGPKPNPLKCNGTAGICMHFYDSAPSGRYGTMSYMCKAALQMLHFPVNQEGNLDCIIS